MCKNKENNIDLEQLKEIVKPLLDWYDKNARILPWRENTDPYRVWVSEIMLQQTRVEAVKPFFARFMQQLPTLCDLAEVEEETLMKLWEGLGYYTRVRNLQKAAKLICKNFGGIFPNNYEDMLLLPGVGGYTAGAISSISFGNPTPAVDGNVLRVITRLTETYVDISSPALKEHITQGLADVYPLSRSGDFTQSIMELGAIICTPNGIPKCEACPLSFLCKAYLHNTQQKLPVKARKKPRKQDIKTGLLLRCDDKIAVRKRDSGGLLGGLWEFPNVEGCLTLQEVGEWLTARGIYTDSMISSSKKKHIFTHVEWDMSCYLVDCCTINEDFLWVSRETLDSEITLPSAFKKFCELLFEDEND